MKIIDQIIEDKRSVIFTYVDHFGDKLGKEIHNKYERYRDQLNSKEVFKDLEVMIGGLLLDMKSIVANDEKIRQKWKSLQETQQKFIVLFSNITWEIY